MEEFAIGTISGVIAAAIIGFIQLVYLRIIRPWYEERVYCDAHIEGQWTVKYKNMNKPVEELIMVARKAHSVTGRIHVTKGPDQGKAYDFSGTFRNMILTLTYVSSDPTALDRGAYVVLLKDNGKEFCGHSSYYQDEHKIEGAECTWIKNP